MRGDEPKGDTYQILTCCGIPHMRGDEPNIVGYKYNDETYTPHAWG